MDSPSRHESTSLFRVWSWHESAGTQSRVSSVGHRDRRKNGVNHQWQVANLRKRRRIRYSRRSKTLRQILEQNQSDGLFQWEKQVHGQRQQVTNSHSFNKSLHFQTWWSRKTQIIRANTMASRYVTTNMLKANSEATFSILRRFMSFFWNTRTA